MSIKRQTLWNLAPTLVTAVVGFFSLPWFYKYLGTEMYAIQGYINSLATAFGFADLGLGVAVGRFVSVALGKNDQSAARDYWGTGNLIVLPSLALVTLAFVGLTVTFGPRWFNIPPGDEHLLQACFAVNGLGLFFSYYGSYWLAISQAFLDFKFIGLIRTVVTLLQMIPAMALAYFTHNVLWILIWGAAISALQLGVLIWHARRHYSLGFCLGRATLARAREMAGYTSKMFLGLVVNSVFSSIDLRFLGRLVLPAQYSPYVFTSKITQQLQGLSVAVMGPVLHNTARVAGHDRASAARIYNDTFAFLFEWYLFAAIWLVIWHAVLLRLWLTHTLGAEQGQATALLIGPLFTPLMAACILGAIANVSNSQLASINRLGSTVWFAAAAGLLAVAGVWAGWRIAGLTGAAYGFLISRSALVAQDFYVIILINAGGWLDRRTWMQAGFQGLVAAVFALAYLAWPHDPIVLLVAASLHAALMGGWLLRQPLRKWLASTPMFGGVQSL